MVAYPMIEPSFFKSIALPPKIPHRQRSITTDDADSKAVVCAPPEVSNRLGPMTTGDAAPGIPSRRGSMVHSGNTLLVVSPPRYPNRRGSVATGSISMNQEETFHPPIRVIFVPVDSTPRRSPTKESSFSNNDSTMGHLKPEVGFLKSIARPPKLPGRQRSIEVTPTDPGAMAA